MTLADPLALIARLSAALFAAAPRALLLRETRQPEPPPEDESVPERSVNVPIGFER